MKLVRELLVGFISFAVLCCCPTHGQGTESCTVENELTFNPTNCKQYYRCLSGERILFSCSDGKVFDGASNRCVSSDLDCSESTVAVTTTTEAPSSLLCSEKMDGIVSHPSDCDKYVVCVGGFEAIHSCPNGQQFSWRSLACGVDNSCEDYYTSYGETVESVACKRQTLALAEDPFRVDGYVDCGRQASRVCQAGLIFRWNYQRCLPGSATTNELWSASANCGFFGKSAHPFLCEKYFQCQFWISSLQSCPNGTIYSEQSGACVPGDFRTCLLET